MKHFAIAYRNRMQGWVCSMVLLSGSLAVLAAPVLESHYFMPLDSSSGFGYSVALTKDLALIGTIDGVIAKEKTLGTWTNQYHVTTTDGECFTCAVLLTDQLAILRSENTVYFFPRQNRTLTQPEHQKIDLQNPARIHQNSISQDGKTLAIGHANATVSVFENNGSQWELQQVLTPPTIDDINFGEAVAVGDNTLIVGQFIYTRISGQWTLQQKLLRADVTEPFRPQWGRAVAISGNTAIIGDTTENNNSAYVYIRKENSWQLQQKLTASDESFFYGNGICGDACDQFGWTVALDGNIAIIGSMKTGNETGAAYLFTRNNNMWQEKQILAASDAMAFDWFSYSISLSGQTALIGTAVHGRENLAGVAYLYELGPLVEQCDYTDAYQNNGWGWDSTNEMSCEPITCDYTYAPQNSGWGWDSVNSLSCAPLDEPGFCDYTDAELNDGWGWNHMTKTSCQPL